jgi:signal transduction histidine kinase
MSLFIVLRDSRTTILAIGLSVTFCVAALLPFLVLLLAQRQRAAVTMNEARIAKETFSHTLGIVCHELRNPVHALKGILVFGSNPEGSNPGGLSAADVAQALECVDTIAGVLNDVVEMQRTDVVSPLQVLWFHQCCSVKLPWTCPPADKNAAEDDAN